MIAVAFLHITLMRFKPDTAAAQIAEAIEEGRAFRTVEGVDVMAAGEVAAAMRLGDGPKDGFTHALVLRIADEEALARYWDDPRHAVQQETMVPRFAEIAIVDVPL